MGIPTHLHWLSKEQCKTILYATYIIVFQKKNTTVFSIFQEKKARAELNGDAALVLPLSVATVDCELHGVLRLELDPCLVQVVNWGGPHNTLEELYEGSRRKGN